MYRSGAAIVIAAALLLTGCVPESSTTDPTPTVGSPSPTSASPTSVAPTSAAPTSSATPSEPSTPSTDSVEGIAELIGLADFAISDEESPYIVRWGKGTLDGSDVRVYEFADEQQFATYVDSVAGFGITADSFARVGNFAVAPTDPAQLAQIRASLG